MSKPSKKKPPGTHFGVGFEPSAGHMTNIFSKFFSALAVKGRRRTVYAVPKVSSISKEHVKHTRNMTGTSILSPDTSVIHHAMKFMINKSLKLQPVAGIYNMIFSSQTEVRARSEALPYPRQKATWKYHKAVCADLEILNTNVMLKLLVGLRTQDVSASLDFEKEAKKHGFTEERTKEMSAELMPFCHFQSAGMTAAAVAPSHEEAKHF
ncbi:hypothetical protein FB451DRAFT_1172387 [Mycena latifolia]|nr:hypothetical protein FB451DRAFT_1172387 [Mycena latifolia]